MKLAIVFALCFSSPALALADGTPDAGPLPAPPTLSGGGCGAVARLAECNGYLSTTKEQLDACILRAAKCEHVSEDVVRAQLTGAKPKTDVPSPVVVVHKATPKAPKVSKPTMPPPFVPEVIARNGRDGKDGRNGADGKDGQNGQNGQNGRDGQDGHDGADAKSVYPIIGGGYRFTTIDSKGRPTATTYGPEIQLRLALGDRWELSTGGSFIQSGDNATMLHGSLDFYPLKWIGASLGLSGQWLGINDNAARGQIIGATYGVVFKPIATKYVDVRCDFSGIIGSNGFIGGRDGGVLANGVTGACGIGLHP